MKSKIYNILKFVLSSIIFFYMGLLIKCGLSRIFPPFIIDLNHIMNASIYLIINDLLFCIIIVCFYKNILKEDYIKFKNKVAGGSLVPYLKIVARYTVIVFMLKFLSAYIITFISMLFDIPISTSSNQSAVETVSKATPVIMAISVSVLAPLSEELLFRGALGKVLNKKGIFITVSGLIFGLMHITDSMLILGSIFLIGLVLEMIYESEIKKRTLLSVISIALYLLIVLLIMYFVKFDLINYIKHINYTELINSISYIMMGCYLAYIYKLEDNILINVGVHSMNNIISFILFLVVI